MTKIYTPADLAASGTEDGEQEALFCYANEQARLDPLWALLFAIPNGGQREKSSAARKYQAPVELTLRCGVSL